MADLYKLLTRSDALNRLVNRAPAVIDVVNGTPMPVRFRDGRRRLATFRLLRMTRLWADYPDEADASYARYDGGDVIDVGAYHGWYAALLAGRSRPGDKLVCFEPDPAAYAELLHNLATLAGLFPAQRFIALPDPVGDGRPAAVTYPEGSGHPRVGSADDEGAPATRTIDTIVELHGLRPTFVKVDVEGAESFVLRGMQRTLQAFRPRLMLEVHPLWQPEGVAVQDVERLLLDQGYTRSAQHDDPLAVRQWWDPPAA
jgi:FkbM family methyltransferase